jgi:hypothetical protein
VIFPEATCCLEVKTRETEMRSDRAKVLLSAYRANSADALDPVFKEALEQVQRDPVLANWFQEQQHFDEMISVKLRSIEPPAGLEAAMLAALRTTSMPRYPLARWLAVAAALILGLMVVGQMQLNAPWMQDRFRAFYSYALADFKPDPHLDLQTTNFRQTQEFIRAKGAPAAPNVPPSVASLPTAGCKTFVWQGEPASLTCIDLPGGQRLHLFVIDKKAFRGQLIPRGFRKIGDWNVKFSESDGMITMWVSRAPVEEFRGFVS